MNGDELTPTKAVSRVNLSPYLKEAVCILCVEAIQTLIIVVSFYWLQ